MRGAWQAHGSKLLCHGLAVKGADTGCVVLTCCDGTRVLVVAWLSFGLGMKKSTSFLAWRLLLNVTDGASVNIDDHYDGTTGIPW